jgi:hypothetical protein
MKPKQFYLDIPVLNSSCWFVWNITSEQAKDWLFKKFKIEYEFEKLGLTTDACAVLGSIPIIFISKWSNTPNSYAILAHECVHVANFIIQERQIIEKEGHDEMQAYLVGHLVESFLEALKKKL